jgi:phosphohistidine phosphatase SixA
VSASTSYVLLCRHGKHDAGTLSDQGRRDVETVADTLAETLARPLTPGGEQSVRVGAILVAPTPEARATADAVWQKLRPVLEILVEPVEQDWLAPKWAWDKADDGHEELASSVSIKSPANAVLVVGHLPQLSWMSTKLLRSGYALAHAEVACVSVGGRWRRRWVPWSIAPRDDEVRLALIDKIRSKMDTAKLFSAILALALGVILDQDKLHKATGPGDADRILGELAAGLLVAGLVLYLATLYAYDSLLMPSRFWRDSKQAPRRAGRWLSRRPPTSSTLVLYQNMTRIWTWLFTPATICIAVGLMLLGVAVVDPSRNALIGAAAGFIVLTAWIRHFRPVLGSED